MDCFEHLRSFTILVSLTGVGSALFSCGGRHADLTAPTGIPTDFDVPDGFIVEETVAHDIVSYPMFATFDNEGRLFVIESSGKTTSTEDVLENPTFKILLLEDKNDDGVFDTRHVFADKLPYPMGGTFYRGSFYATAPPDVIRLTDTDADGVADKREVLLTGWTLNHNAATLSGPFMGPDGWMYMCDARRGFNIKTKENTQLTGKGARIWRCRPDGTGLEWVSGGGFDNTIEMVFMPSGETIGTMTYFTDPQDGFRDALMHWVEGGVYPKPYPVIEEDRLKLTGDLMPVMTKLPRVSPAGLMKYRGEAFGAEYRGNLFSAQFNTGRIMRHTILADGATFRTEDQPFMQAANLEMHPTDVLEDADGSLLVVNTGGWFIAGCPLSVVAKADIHGTILRIRKKDAPIVNDPWGRKIDFRKSTAEELVALLGDHRPMVREKAIERLIELRDKSVEPLTKILFSSSREEERTTAVFALYRGESPDAMTSIVSALDDKSAMVRTAAARVLGIARHRDAVEGLCRLLSDGNLGVRRQAATALGQIADERAVAPLIASSGQATDRFVQHAITYSLVTIGKAEALVRALRDRSENVRRTALIALDQMDDSPLGKSDVIPFLASANAELQKTGIWVASRHPEWSDIVINYLKERVVKPGQEESEMKRVKELLVSMSGNHQVQGFVAARLKDPATSAAEKSLMLNVMREAPQAELPRDWVNLLGSLLDDGDAAVRVAALDVIQSRRIAALDEKLAAVIENPNTAAAFRIKALGARIMSRPQLSDEEFSIVRGMMRPGNEPFIRQAAVGLLAQAELSPVQLRTLANEDISNADIFLLPGLVSAFEGSHDEQAGMALISVLSRDAGRLDNLSVESMEKLFKSYPPSVTEAAGPLVNTLKERQASRLSALEKLQSSLTHGDVGEGRKLFFGKALCSTCHAVAGQGAIFGPDLTNIGEIRSQHDILEAILYPAASLAREYETSRVVTKATSYSGIIKEQLGDVVVMESGPGIIVRVPVKEITAIEPQDISLMPPGLDKQLTTQEMSDLMAYLSTLPDGLGHLRQ